MGWGLTQGFVSWVAREGEVRLIIKVGRWDFFNFPRNLFFGGVGWGGWKKGVGLFFSLLFSFVTWWLNEDFFSRKYFIKVNFIFLGMENFNTKIEFKIFNRKNKNIYCLNQTFNTLNQKKEKK